MAKHGKRHSKAHPKGKAYGFRGTPVAQRSASNGSGSTASTASAPSTASTASTSPTS